MENTIQSAAEFFETHGWVKIEKYISKEMCDFLYFYTKLSAKRLLYVESVLDDYNSSQYRNVYGTFEDSQAPSSFSSYGDLVFDTLLASSTQSISNIINKKLIPTYSYYRLYVEGNELVKHVDRKSCKISSTLCLGYDVSNVDQQMYNNYNWAMWAKGFTGEETAINLQPGDMIIYKGDQIEHWREKFLGLNHSQLFLHYNESHDHNNLFDDREELGIPQIL